MKGKKIKERWFGCPLGSESLLVKRVFVLLILFVIGLIIAGVKDAL